MWPFIKRWHPAVTLFAVGLALGWGRIACGQVDYGTDAVITTSISDVLVGFDDATQMPSSCTVTIAPNGWVINLEVITGSTAILDGGLVSNNALAVGFAPGGTLIVKSGSFGALEAGESNGNLAGTINIMGGQTLAGATATVTVDGVGVLNLSGGTINGEVISGAVGSPTNETPTLNLTGGTINGNTAQNGTVLAQDGTTVTLNGTAIQQALTLTGTSSLNFSSGSVGTDVSGGATNSITMGGGTIGRNLNVNGPTVVTGGTIVGDVTASGPQAIVALGAKQIGGDVTAGNGAVVTVTGPVTGSLVTSVGTLTAGAITVGGGVTQVATGAVTLNGTTVAGNVSASGTTFNANGAAIGGNVEIASFGGETYAMNGGSVGGNVNVEEGGTFNLVAGTVGGNITVNDTSKVAVSGDASKLGFLVAQTGFSGTATMSGGTASGLTAQAGTITLSGGNGGNLDAVTAGTINVTGGSVNNVLVDAGGHATLGAVPVSGNVTVTGGKGLATAGTLTGTTVAGNLAVSSGAVAFTTGGSVVGDASVADFSILDMSKTSIGGPVTAKDNANLSLADGNVILGVSVSDSSAVLSAMTVGQDVTADGATGVILSNGTTVAGMLHASGHAMVTLQQASVVSSDFVSALADGNATISMQDGSLSGQLASSGSGAVNLGGGVVQALIVNGGTGTISGGQVRSNAQTFANSVLTITGGTVDQNANAFFGNLEIAGGTIGGDATAANDAIMDLSAGKVAGNVTAANQSRVSIGGTVTIAGNVVAHDSSSVTIDGGQISGQVQAFDSSIVTLSGTQVPTSPSARIAAGAGEAQGAALADVLPEIFLNDNSTLEVDGHALSSLLLDPASEGGTFSEFEVTGQFADGSAIPGGLLVFVENGSAASFRLVEAPAPEPATEALWLGAVSAAFVRRRRRAARQPTGE